MTAPDAPRSTPRAGCASETPFPTFADVMARRSPEERARLQGMLDEQRRTLPERVVEAGLIRAMSKLLASPFICETHNCQKFMPPEDMPGPSCDWRTADAATLEAVQAPHRPVCPLCEPERALATIHHTYPETRP